MLRKGYIKYSMGIIEKFAYLLDARGRHRIVSMPSRKNTDINSELLSPKISIAMLHDITQNLYWRNKGIEINVEFICNLCFTHDRINFAKTSKQLEAMIRELNNASKKRRFTIKNIQNNNIYKQDTRGYNFKQTIEYVDSYVYLGKQISFNIIWRKQLQRNPKSKIFIKTYKERCRFLYTTMSVIWRNNFYFRRENKT